MEKKTELTLQELLKRLGVESEAKLRDLLESLLEDSKKGHLIKPKLDKHLDIESLLKINREQTLPHLIDLDVLRKIRKQLEEKIEALIEKIVSLLEQLRKQRKDLVKHVPLERKRLLKLLLALVNLINLKDLIERLESIIEKGK
ncbi:hypothetical protein [Alkalihalobacterium alkalinitrilicum]|uniref:hypothetical protein n=1 Tax=Alkalihalobacterium alkalinitrilicum TaxID=427920 RepID=UPI000995B437|nr:hypothetical protein [Alkalihalobacterium alkalinitrilicum]